MCSILGYCGTPTAGKWSLIHRVLHELLIASAIRGTDATGFVALTRPSLSTGKHNVVVAKRPEPSPVFATTNRAWKQLRPSLAVLGHTRLATRGTPENNSNNHPFITEDRRFALVHNGCISNADELAEDLGLQLTTDCDSEVLLRIVEAARSPARGLAACLRLVRGSMSCAVLDARKREVWLARDVGRPLAVAKLHGLPGYIWGSTPELLHDAIIRALGRKGRSAIDLLVPLGSEAIYRLTPKGQLTVYQRQVASQMLPPLDSLTFQPSGMSKLSSPNNHVSS